MDIRQLRYFVAVLDHRNFTKAAEAVRIAQPALGLQIRKLEDELDVQLLVRHSRGVDATEAGTMLYERARAILADIDAAKHAIRYLTGEPRGRLTLGMTPSIGAILASRLVGRAAQRFPLISLVLVEELSVVLAEWVASDRLDMAVAYDVPQAANLSRERLLEEDLFLVEAAAGAPAEESVPFDEAAAKPLLVPGAPHQLRRYLEDTAQRRGGTLNVTFEIQSVPILRQLVADGIGATVLPYGAVRRECELGVLRARKIVEPGLSRSAFLLTTSRRPLSRGEAALRDLILAAAQEEAAAGAGYWGLVAPAARTGSIQAA